MISDDRLHPLLEDVERLLRNQRARHLVNFLANWLLIICALSSTALVVVGGTMRWSHEAISLIGVAGSIAVGLQTALAIEDRAEFQRVVSSELQNIVLCLRDPELEDRSFGNLRQRFMDLRIEANKRLPRGGGVEAARRLPPLQA